jgi:hypothetical protein
MGPSMLASVALDKNVFYFRGPPSRKKRAMRSPPVHPSATTYAVVVWGDTRQQ